MLKSVKCRGNQGGQFHLLIAFAYLEVEVLLHRGVVQVDNTTPEGEGHTRVEAAVRSLGEAELHRKAAAEAEAEEVHRTEHTAGSSLRKEGAWVGEGQK